VGTGTSCGPGRRRDVMVARRRVEELPPTTSHHGDDGTGRPTGCKVPPLQPGTCITRSRSSTRATGVEVGSDRGGPSPRKVRWRWAITSVVRSCRGGPQLRGRDHPVARLVHDVLTSIHIEAARSTRGTKLAPRRSQDIRTSPRGPARPDRARHSSASRRGPRRRHPGRKVTRGEPS